MLAFIENRSWLAPVQLDAGVTDLLTEQAKLKGLQTLSMPSGAGHDVQIMQALCPAGLVFVPSQGGLSHSAKEFSDWQDIEQGGDLILATLLSIGHYAV